MKPVLPVILLLFMQPHALAELSGGSKLITEVQQATPILRIEPKYPVSAARNAQEGWVQLSFVIQEDGSVVDPVVEDSSGIKSFEKAALRAMKKWKYKPALQDGKPIQQCQSKVQMDFKLTKDDEGVRRKFRNAYIKAKDALEEGKLEDVAIVIDKLSADKLWNMSENSWFWMLDANYAKAIEDPKRELKSIRKALPSEKADKFIGPGNYLILLQRKFVLEVKDNQYLRSSNTFQQIEAHPKGQKLADSLRKYALEINDFIKSDTPLVTLEKVGRRGRVFHTLARSEFSLADIDGNLQTLDIRCKNKRMTYSVAADTTWKIPQKWGACSVIFEGDEGASFKIVELSGTSA